MSESLEIFHIACCGNYKWYYVNRYTQYWNTENLSEKMPGFSHLVGRTLLSYKENLEKYRIEFTTDKGVYCYKLTAPCCSETYVENFEDFKDIVGKEILRIEEKPIVVKGEYHSSLTQDNTYTQVYSVDFITMNGTATLEFRNDSNGAYGAEIELIEIVNEEGKS